MVAHDILSTGDGRCVIIIDMMMESSKFTGVRNSCPNWKVKINRKFGKSVMYTNVLGKIICSISVNSIKPLQSIRKFTKLLLDAYFKLLLFLFHFQSTWRYFASHYTFSLLTFCACQANIRGVLFKWTTEFLKFNAWPHLIGW